MGLIPVALQSLEAKSVSAELSHSQKGTKCVDNQAHLCEIYLAVISLENQISPILHFLNIFL